MAIPLSLSEVPNETPYVQYVATNGQTVYPYPFPITQDSDLVVDINGIPLATDTGYSLSGQGNDTGGNVTLSSGSTAGDIVTLFRDIQIERLTQFSQNGGFSSSAFNAEFNNLYLIAQQLEASVAQCLQIPNTNNPAPTTTLAPAAYANKYQAYDANGNPTPALLTSSGSVTAGIIGSLLYPPKLSETGLTLNLGYPYGNVWRYGANTSAVDNSAAFTAAMSCNSLVYAPTGTYTFTLGITVPPGVELRGDGCFATNPQAGGTVLSFANAVAKCVTVNNAVSNGAGNLRALTVTRSGGAPPGGSIGVYQYGGYNVILQDVFSLNHAIAFYFKANSSGLGISAHVDKIYSGAVSDAHIVLDTWPEFYCTNSRFGMNGSGDIAGTTYIRVQGGVPGSANGPSTVHFSMCQFNQGSNPPSYFWQFTNLNGSVPTIDATDFLLSGCHVEGITVAYFYSDSTWNIIDRLVVTSNVFNSVVPLFALNAATSPSEWQFSDNDIFASTVSLAPTGQISAVEFSSNRITGTVSMTGVAGSTLVLSDNSHGGNVTVSGVWGYVKLSGSFTAGAFTWSATSASIVSLEGNFATGSWTPVINFGGAHVGQAYTLQAGSFQVIGNRICGDFAITISNLGSSTGTCTISGLPYPIVNKSAAQGGGGVVTYALPMASISAAPLLLNGQINTSVLSVYQSATNGIATINQGNFGSVPVSLSGTFSYEWQ